jgi:superoxide dismutase, Cu-Zn family
MKLHTLCLLSAAVVFIGQALPAQAQVRRMREAAQEGERAVCVLHPIGKNDVTGVIYFEQMGSRIRITGKIHGLTPGKHGFHVHQYGDLSDHAKGESAGGHWNPKSMPHGAPDTKERHVGDLGNVEANAEGNAIVDEYDRMLRFHGSDSIIGRALVVHEKADTFVQPTGAAGGRVAFGVIGWAKPATTAASR